MRKIVKATAVVAVLSALSFVYLRRSVEREGDEEYQDVDFGSRVDTLVTLNGKMFKGEWTTTEHKAVWRLG